MIHSIAAFLRLLQWKGSEKRYSFVCLIALILARSIQQYLVYSLPCLLFMLEIHHQQQSIDSQQHLQQHDDEPSESALVYDLMEIRDTICFLTTARNWMQQSDTLCTVYHFYYSMASKKTRSFICVGVSCLFMMAYAGWVILLQQQQIHLSSLIWFALVMIMCAHSPWVQPIQTACVRAMLPLISYAMAHKDTTSTECTKEEPAENQKRYRFELYHHQRWWFPTGWSNLLLPQDRAVWYVFMCVYTDDVFMLFVCILIVSLHQDGCSFRSNTFYQQLLLTTTDNKRLTRHSSTKDCIMDLGRSRMVEIPRCNHRQEWLGIWELAVETVDFSIHRIRHLHKKTEMVSRCSAHRVLGSAAHSRPSARGDGLLG